MNFLPSVFLSPAPDDLFVSAALACEAYGRRRVLTHDSALRLGVLRGEAQREQAPYMKDQHRYLAALAHLLEYDFMATAGAGFPFGASKDVSTGAQPSLVAEFFITALSIAAQCERGDDHERGVRLLHTVDRIVRERMTVAIMAQRIRLFLSGLPAWEGTLGIVRAMYALRQYPPVDASLKVEAVRTLRQLSLSVGGNTACDAAALALEDDVMRRMEQGMAGHKGDPDEDILRDRVLLLKATGQEEKARSLIGKHSSSVTGISRMMALPGDDARKQAQRMVEDVTGGAVGRNEWPPLTLRALPDIPLKLDIDIQLEDATATAAAPVLTITRALELRSYAVESKDQESLGALDRWLGLQGYTLKAEGVRAALETAGLLIVPPAPSLWAKTLETMKMRLTVRSLHGRKR